MGISLGTTTQGGAMLTEHAVPLPDGPTHPLLCRLLDYWTGKHLDGRPPRRADIDPIDLGPILPHVFLLDRFADGAATRCYRIRLFGTALARFHGRDLTGKWLHEALPPAVADTYVMALDRLVGGGPPIVGAGTVFYDEEKSWKSYETCQVPLADAAGALAMVLGAVIYR